MKKRMLSTLEKESSGAYWCFDPLLRQAQNDKDQGDRLFVMIRHPEPVEGLTKGTSG